MLILRHRLAAAGVITAAAIAVPAAAMASGPGSPSGKPAAPASNCAAPAVSKSAAPAASNPAAPAAVKSAAARSRQSQLNALAASAGISVSRLQAGLAAMKQAGGGTAGIAAFAASTGVSHATAQRVVDAVAGS